MSHTWGSVKGRLPLHTELHLGTCGGQATFTNGAGRYHNIEYRATIFKTTPLFTDLFPVSYYELKMKSPGTPTLYVRLSL
jgi:hypothetical protein